MSTADSIAPRPRATTVQEFKRELESLPSAGRLTNADVEALYSLAYREYNAARYEAALQCFQVLQVYRPTNTMYLLGTALCLQRLRLYERAALVYVALHHLEEHQPGHILAAAECQLLCHERTKARESLEKTIESCRAIGGHEQVRARAQAMLELMRPQNVPVDA